MNTCCWWSKTLAIFSRNTIGYLVCFVLLVHCSIGQQPITTFRGPCWNSAFCLMRRVFTTLPLVNLVWPPFHVMLLMLLQFVHHLSKFIFHSFQLQKSWDFLHHVHKNVYYLIMIFTEFLVGWIFNCIRFLNMYAYLIPCAKTFAKWSCCIQCPWNFLWWN